MLTTWYTMKRLVEFFKIFCLQNNLEQKTGFTGITSNKSRETRKKLVKYWPTY